jgi:hypothetical protein
MVNVEQKQKNHGEQKITKVINRKIVKTALKQNQQDNKSADLEKNPCWSKIKAEVLFLKY